MGGGPPASVNNIGVYLVQVRLQAAARLGPGHERPDPQPPRVWRVGQTRNAHSVQGQARAPEKPTNEAEANCLNESSSEGTGRVTRRPKRASAVPPAGSPLTSETRYCPGCVSAASAGVSDRWGEFRRRQSITSGCIWYKYDFQAAARLGTGRERPDHQPPRVWRVGQTQDAHSVQRARPERLRHRLTRQRQTAKSSQVPKTLGG